MDKEGIISDIIKLELEITSRILSDRNFRPSVDDEYKNHREQLVKLRDILFSEIKEEKKSPNEK